MKSRGADTTDRSYSVVEWIKGYAAWVAVFPIYLLLWLFAVTFKRIPNWLRKLLLREWERETSRPVDVRIPADPSVAAYMNRWWKIRRNAFFNTYYHRVQRSDDDRALHDHPWWNFSIILSGGYFEHTIAAGGVHRKTWYPEGSVRFRRHGAFAHRLELKQAYVGGLLKGLSDKAEIPVNTIFITGPVLRRWGFHHPTGWVDAYDWDDFCDRNGIGGMKMEGYAEQLEDRDT